MKLLPDADAPSAPAQSQAAAVNGTGFRSVPGYKDWSQAEEVVRLPLTGEGTASRLDQVIEGLRDSGRL